MRNEIPDLIIPVYLNQRLVFDLVAMLQGGIATVTRVSEAQRDTDRGVSELTGGFGLSQAFASLLKVNLSGKLSEDKEETVERISASDRVHTPASLFFTLRNLLIHRGVLQQKIDDTPPSPGTFVEFTAALRRNPLIEGLGAVVEILDLVRLFTGEAPKSTQQPGKQRQQPGKQQSQSQPDLRQLREQLNSLAASLKAGGTQDLVADLTESAYRAVLTVEEQYLNDPSMSDLVDGTFRVVGKVTRSVVSNRDSISLLRKTAMSRFPTNIRDGVTAAFSKLTQEHGFAMPTMEVEIEGPVIQVLPLAIFS